MKSAKLGDVAKIILGATPKTAVADNWDGNVLWVTPADLSRLNGAYISDTLRKLTEEGVRSCATTVLPPGSVLLSSRAPIGHVAINTVPMATNQGFKSLIPGPQLNLKFLYYWLKSNTDYLQSLGNGATFKELSKETTSQIEIPLPPLDEQGHIAAILDHADALRTKRRQVLAHLGTLTQSIFHDMFDGVSTSAAVEALAAKAKGSIRTGPFGSQLLHGEFVDDGIAVLGLDNVIGNEFRWAGRRFITLAKYEQLARYTVYPGDVLVSIMGTTGRCVVVPDDIPTAINTKHICAITPDRERLNPVFLQAVFLWHPESRGHLLRQTKGSIMDGLNMGIIKAMPVPVPALKLQQEFANRVARVTAQRTAVLAAKAAGDELFTSLQSRAFRGEL